MKTLLILAVACCTILGACKETAQTQPPPTTTSVEYIPLAVGNWWRYQKDSGADSGIVTEYKVVGDVLIGNDSYWETKIYIITDTAQPAIKDTIYYRQLTDRTITKYKNDVIDSSRYVMFHYLDSFFPTDSSVAIAGYYPRFMIDTTKVPAGTFYNTVFTDYQLGAHIADAPYRIVKPGIGIVEFGGFKWRSRLISYYINQNN